MALTTSVPASCILAVSAFASPSESEILGDACIRTCQRSIQSLGTPEHLKLLFFHQPLGITVLQSPLAFPDMQRRRGQSEAFLACERRGRMVMPACPPTTGTETLSGCTPLSSATNALALTTSSFVTPSSLRGSYVPALVRYLIRWSVSNKQLMELCGFARSLAHRRRLGNSLGN